MTLSSLNNGLRMPGAGKGLIRLLRRRWRRLGLDQVREFLLPYPSFPSITTTSNMGLLPKISSPPVQKIPPLELPVWLISFSHNRWKLSADISFKGFLDGALLDPMAGPSNWTMDQVGGPDALRISFNSAEADLSFGNYSSELFSISEGFEEFLASHAMPSGLSSVHGAVSGSVMGNSTANPAALAAQLEAVNGAAGLVALGHGQQGALTIQHTKHDAQNDSAVPGEPSASASFAPYGSQIHDYFPVFSSLGLPMPLTRASSPTPHSIAQYQNHDHQHSQQRQATQNNHHPHQTS